MARPPRRAAYAEKKTLTWSPRGMHWDPPAAAPKSTEAAPPGAPALWLAGGAPAPGGQRADPSPSTGRPGRSRAASASGGGAGGAGAADAPSGAAGGSSAAVAIGRPKGPEGSRERQVRLSRVIGSGKGAASTGVEQERYHEELDRRRMGRGAQARLGRLRTWCDRGDRGHQGDAAAQRTKAREVTSFRWCVVEVAG
ncbi:unnamed protein product [Prorocentrum cordatum]|uniref:Uncharacterized protein n=1 Tax=Prorocentrum cordatum TaxID=2364126 RepID=A0ABN9S0C8_9DINO|nr:unnamed protein product [Polarella glacialis]